MSRDDLLIETSRWCREAEQNRRRQNAAQQRGEAFDVAPLSAVAHEIIRLIVIALFAASIIAWAAIIGG